MKISDHAVANMWWDPSSLPSWLTEECYRQRIQPLLRGKKLRELAEAMQVSQPLRRIHPGWTAPALRSSHVLGRFEAPKYPTATPCLLECPSARDSSPKVEWLSLRCPAILSRNL